MVGRVLIPCPLILIFFYPDLLPATFIPSDALLYYIMNKTILISISAALLLAAVLCTAGCVEAPSDPIVGDWVAETDSSVTYAVFENGGTGCFAEAAAEETETGEDAWVLKGTCSWAAAADSKNTYTLTFADGETETAVLDAEHGLMTIGGVEYQKYPSGLSGGVRKPLVWELKEATSTTLYGSKGGN